MELLISLGLLVTAFAMVFSKRVSALVGNFRLQSLLLCALTFLEGAAGLHADLLIISAIILALKVVIIPMMLLRIASEIKINENLGFFISPELSLVASLALAYPAWLLSGALFEGQGTMVRIFSSTSFLMMSLGLFVMIFRMKAIAQIVGLLAIENGIFLLASLVGGGMPFLVEMAIFFDVLVGVVILGIFVYRINRLFVSIDVSKLNRLKG